MQLLFCRGIMKHSGQLFAIINVLFYLAYNSCDCSSCRNIISSVLPSVLQFELQAHHITIHGPCHAIHQHFFYYAHTRVSIQFISTKSCTVRYTTFMVMHFIVKQLFNAVRKFVMDHISPIKSFQVPFYSL